MACNKVLKLQEETKSQQQLLDRMQALEQRMQAQEQLTQAQEQLNKDKDQRTKELEMQVQAQIQLNIFQARCIQLQKGTCFLGVFFFV